MPVKRHINGKQNAATGDLDAGKKRDNSCTGAFNGTLP